MYFYVSIFFLYSSHPSIRYETLHRQISAPRICRDYLFYKNRLLYQLPICMFRPCMQSRRIVPVICKRSTLWLTTSLCWLLVIAILLFWFKSIQWIQFVLSISSLASSSSGFLYFYSFQVYSYWFFILFLSIIFYMIIPFSFYVDIGWMIRLC